MTAHSWLYSSAGMYAGGGLCPYFCAKRVYEGEREQENYLDIFPADMNIIMILDEFHGSCIIEFNGRCIYIDT